MDIFYEPDPNSVGAKGLVFIGANVLVYRRDFDAQAHPGELDLPGGGPILGETPFQTFQREVKEEFDLDLKEANIVDVKLYPSSIDPHRTAYFPIARLPKSAEKQIKLGNEGSEFLLMSPGEYIRRPDGWETFQQRTKDYLDERK